MQSDHKKTGEKGLKVTPEEKKRNDTVGPGDDTIGENTEETPLAEAIRHPETAGRQSPSEELE
ncbi:MAG: hypothetical protein INR69_07940 [Mucilaginibacter polytrichastri]|nr:hypothetical protein [Mucilaginibacter polytrichastri]